MKLRAIFKRLTVQVKILLETLLGPLVFSLELKRLITNDTTKELSEAIKFKTFFRK